MLRKIFLLTSLLVLAVATQAADQFIAGKHYEILPEKIAAAATAEEKTQVLEFFNYVCRWCRQLEPYVGNWRESAGKDVGFRRVAVVFHRHWLPFAQAFYIADALGVEPKVTSKLFALGGKPPRKGVLDEIAKIFAEQGVTKDIFDKAMQDSAALDLYLAQAKALMKRYRAETVPMFIVNGKYRVTVSMAGGQDMAMKVVQYLIDKDKAVAGDAVTDKATTTNAVDEAEEDKVKP